MGRASHSAGAPHLVVAVAIVAAGALIAAGLYFGLRDRGASSEGGGGGATTAGPEARAAGPDLQTRVENEVRRALEGLRPTMVERCWSPDAALDPEPARARYSFHITVDATGRELGRGVSEFRDATRPAVGRCLRALHDAPVQVPPPGETVTVEVTLTLPDDDLGAPAGEVP